MPKKNSLKTPHSFCKWPPYKRKKINTMKWIHIKAVFTGDDSQLAEELVTDIF